jgi:D-mannonate dehydratase
MSLTFYWAHSAPDSLPGSESRDGWQPLSVHLTSVAKIARELALATHPDDDNFARLAGISGLLHDLANIQMLYSECF